VKRLLEEVEQSSGDDVPAGGRPVARVI
jgi:hypothetical protein